MEMKEEMLKTKEKMIAKQLFKEIISALMVSIITFIGIVIGDTIVMNTGLWEVTGVYTGVLLGAGIGGVVGSWLVYGVLGKFFK
jgi:hypothetical protein